MTHQIKYITLICLLVGFYTASAQEDYDKPWEEKDRKNTKALDYQFIREADVMWSKTIWRIVDIRQKINLPFSYPKLPLIQILHEAAKKGEITVYDPAVEDADKCTIAMTTKAVEAIGKSNDTIIQLRPDNPDEEILVPVENHLSWSRITKYRVKEIWYFDTRLSAMQVRILAIAPVMEDIDENGFYRGDMTMYWIRYDSIRPLLTQYGVYNQENDSPTYSWDDLFTMRKFSSFIYKESNVYDRNIQEYATALDAQLESDRIKQKIMEKEHDMWEY